MDIGKIGNSIDAARNTARERETGQVSKAARQEEEAANARTAAVSSPPPAGQPGGAGQAKSQEGAQQAAIQQAAVQQAAGSSSSGDEDNYQSIVNKANSGQSLTASELSTLRSRNPALYAKVNQASTARQQLRRQMEADPNHAAQAAQQAMAGFSQQEWVSAHNSSGGEGQSLLRNALQDEYAGFAAKYDQVLFNMPPTDD